MDKIEFLLVILGVGLVYGATLYMFYVYYTESQRTIEVLNSQLAQWKSDYHSLLENYTFLHDKYVNLSRDLNITLEKLHCIEKNLSKCEERYSILKENYENLSKEFNKTKTKLKRWEFSRKIRNYADLDEIREFLEFDDTDLMEYDAENWNCEDYTNLLIRKLMERGIFACETGIVFEDDTAHAIVAIETEPGRLYYIEPQTDKIIPGSWLYVGADYCDVVNWACDDWIIKKISSCFYISTYDS